MPTDKQIFLKSGPGHLTAVDCGSARSSPEVVQADPFPSSDDKAPRATALPQSGIVPKLLPLPFLLLFGLRFSMLALPLPPRTSGTHSWNDDLNPK
nr:hypothetical protein CFP56_25514 [Quercus suber]